MRKTNVKIIKKNIALLKEQKRKCFNIETGNVDFNVVQETCREMDILLLPLYFAWEHLVNKIFRMSNLNYILRGHIPSFPSTQKEQH